MPAKKSLSTAEILGKTSKILGLRGWKTYVEGVELWFGTAGAATGGALGEAWGVAWGVAWGEAWGEAWGDSLGGASSLGVALGEALGDALGDASGDALAALAAAEASGSARTLRSGLSSDVWRLRRAAEMMDDTISLA